MLRVIAHRGARVEEPENTLRAVKRAAECGADAVEIDVRRSNDQELVIMHDETLDRTTNGSGKVSEQTLEQLRALDAGKGEKIPTLSEVLSLVKALEPELVIELKEPGMEERVVREILEAGMERNVVIASFYHSLLLRMKELAPNLKTGVILSSLPVFPVTLALDAKAAVIFQRYPRLTCEYSEEARRNGLEIYVWIINTVEDFERVRRLGVNGIVTDNPCLFKSR
jgi:glycerophosphoryl diester phosphodiesterase